MKKDVQPIATAPPFGVRVRADQADWLHQYGSKRGAVIRAALDLYKEKIGETDAVH